MPNTILIVAHKHIHPLGEKTPRGRLNIYANSGYFLSYLKCCHIKPVILLLGVKKINMRKHILGCMVKKKEMLGDNQLCEG